MSKRRTKKHKLRTKKLSTTKAKLQTPDSKLTQDLFAYPVKLIYQDLIKTLLVSAVVVMILIALAIFR